MPYVRPVAGSSTGLRLIAIAATIAAAFATATVITGLQPQDRTWTERTPTTRCTTLAIPSADGCKVHISRWQAPEGQGVLGRIPIIDHAQGADMLGADDWVWKALRLSVH